MIQAIRSDCNISGLMQKKINSPLTSTYCSGLADTESKGMTQSIQSLLQTECSCALKIHMLKSLLVVFGCETFGK